MLFRSKKPIHAAVEPPFADYGDHCANGEAVTVVAGSIGTAEPGTPPSIGVSRRNQAGEVGATAGNRTAALRRSVRDLLTHDPKWPHRVGLDLSDSAGGWP